VFTIPPISQRRENSKKALNASELRTVKMYWTDIVFAFSGLDLSFGKDKLPTLSCVEK
jgi:hypothetical protein